MLRTAATVCRHSDAKTDSSESTSTAGPPTPPQATCTYSAVMGLLVVGAFLSELKAHEEEKSLE
uniref:Uncharacterized protein n=1 Tax=Nothobranchius kuhntae TaxID=321403 RepID=A0A1A8J841_NOTKU